MSDEENSDETIEERPKPPVVEISDSKEIPPPPTLNVPGAKITEGDWTTGKFIDSSGIYWIFDADKRVWLPTVASEDKDWAKQQQIYGSTPTPVEIKPEPKPKPKRATENPDGETKKKKKKKKKKKIKNTSVYFTGLPTELTVKEFAAFARKAGIIKKDPTTMEEKVKLYRDAKGNPKGDGLVIYFQEPSVALALSLLDGATFKDSVVHCQRAEFESKPELQTGGKKYSKKVKLYDQKKELDWTEQEKNHVILFSMFTLDEAKEPNFYSELKREIQMEVEKLGEIESVKVFERNPKGVVAIKFSDSIAAEKCVEMMNGRYFAGRQVTAEYYDGFSDYFIPESHEESSKRIDDFGDWLGKDSSDEEDEGA